MKRHFAWKLRIVFILKKIVLILLVTLLFNKIYSQNISNLNVFVADKVEINPGIFGINNDWKFITNDQFPSFGSACSNLNLGVLRYPGGWESEWLDWGTNTTPGWSSAPTTPGASISTVKNNYSNFSVVVPTRSAMEQAYNSTGWNNAIESLKLIAKDAIDRAGAANIQYVEIGNEWWLQYAGGAIRSEKLMKYSKVAMKIAGYIATQYPDRNFNILVNGDFTSPQEFTTIKGYFTESYDEIEGIALHTYTGYQPPIDEPGFSIETLGSKIDECAINFNPNKDLIIYCSEWMAARAYNENRIYMEAANIIPDIIHIYARHGVNAATYWPPINSTAPGVGLVNWNASVVYPCGQILGDLAFSYKGEAVRTTSDSKISSIGALSNTQNLVLYVSGKDNPATNVVIDLHNFNVSNVLKVSRFRPDDYSQTDKAAPYLTESTTVDLKSATSLRFEINKSGLYEIFKIELQGEYIDDPGTAFIDIEIPNYLLYSINKTIYFSAKDGKNTPVWIYSLSGQLIKKYEQPAFSFQSPTYGLYIVRVGNDVKKIAIN